jgi:hypothetical protein
MKEDSDMDAYAYEERIDELLNGFIDDELAARQRTEVERLIAHDVRIEQRLVQLQKCRTLVGSLPRAEAPRQILEGVKASLVRTSPAPLQEEPAHDQRAGRMHLLGRRMLSAAAMITLVGILAGVIYTIVAPETAIHQPEVAVDRQPPVGTGMLEPVSDASVALAFNGRLELKTSALDEVAAIINRAIEENDLSDSIGDVREANRRIHYVRCGRKGLNSLLTGLNSVWSKLDSTTMRVDTEVFGGEVRIDAVTTEQIAEIVDQGSHERRIEFAKDIAVLNSMAERMPGGGILAAIEGQSPSFMSIPKPFITGPESPNAKTPSETEYEKTVRLTIIVSR